MKMRCFFSTLFILSLSSICEAQWKLQTTIKDVNFGINSVDYVETKSNGEKFYYRNNDSLFFFHSNGGVWKSYQSRLATCNGSVYTSFASHYTINEKNGLEYRSTCMSEDGNTLDFITNEKNEIVAKATDEMPFLLNLRKKTFQIQNSSNLLDSAKSCQIFENIDGKNILKKSFAHAKWIDVLFGSEEYYYELTQDFKANYYKKDWSLFKSIQLQKMPNEAVTAYAIGLTQKTFNQDDNWEIELVFLDEKFRTNYCVYNQSGEMIYTAGFSSKFENNNEYIILSYENNRSAVIKKSKMKEVFSFNTNDYTIANFGLKNALLLGKLDKKQSSFSIYSVENQMIKSVNFIDFAQYNIEAVAPVLQPDGTYAFVVTRAFEDTETFKDYRIIYPDNTFQDIIKCTAWSLLYSEYPKATKIFFAKNKTSRFKHDIEIYNFGKYGNLEFKETLNLQNNSKNSTTPDPKSTSSVVPGH
jgi:hypothetical protein